MHANPFILSRNKPMGVLALSKRHFEAWAGHTGVSLDGGYLPWLRRGPIRWKRYPFPGMSCKAFSLLRKKAVVATPKEDWLPGMPLWHSAWFRDTHENTCYSPSVIGQGVRIVEQM